MFRVAEFQRAADLFFRALLIAAVCACGTAFAQPETPPNPIAVPNPATDLWRNVRDRNDPGAMDPGVREVSPGVLARDLWLEVSSRQQEIAGQTQVKGPDAGVLISTQGEQWRHFRMTQLVPIAGYTLAGIIVAIALFRLVRGKIRISEGRSDRRIKRFSLYQRTTHWTVAITFVILALTGCVLTFGRAVLIPVMGNEAFSYLAIASKRIHDFVGPVFGVALVFLFFMFIRGNMPRLKEDLLWILKGGGLLGVHASSHCYNAGEKAWFWLAIVGGAVVVATGLVLDFPIFGQDRAIMSLSHVLHSSAALLLVAVSLGHIYMGTVAMEGAFEVMATGYCDANWAKEHHDLWYEKVADRAEPYPGKPRAGAVIGEDQAASSA